VWRLGSQLPKINMCPECGKRFEKPKIKLKRPKRFCSQKCYMRWYMRQYYQKHKEKVKEIQRRYRGRQILKRVGVLVPLPPPCVCGSRKYRFRYVHPRDKHNTRDYFGSPTVIATCVKCGDKRVFHAEAGKWGPCHLFQKRGEQKRKIGSIFMTEPYVFTKVPYIYSRK